MTVNELVGKIADRAQELADLSMDRLRLEHPDVTGMGTIYEARQVCLGKSRGEIIAEILVEDFSMEFDQDIEG